MVPLPKEQDIKEAHNIVREFIVFPYSVAPAAQCVPALAAGEGVKQNRKGSRYFP